VDAGLPLRELVVTASRRETQSELPEMNPVESAWPIGASTGSLGLMLGQLERALELRVRQVFEAGNVTGDGQTPPVIRLPHGSDPYSRFVRAHQLDGESQLLLVLALAPWIRPDFFDRIVHAIAPEAGDYPQMGGVRGRQHRGFLPTGDTVLFLLAGADLTERLRWQALLLGDHSLVKRGMVYLENAAEGEPPMSGRLSIDAEIAERLLTGHVRAPRMSFRFPARHLETGMEWDDLVLPARTLMQVKELKAWIRHEHTLMTAWGMGKKLRPGCRALFYGPPGTGKTFTATLLGKATGRPVYKVDLSMVVSKYIGETEKNLAALFDKAENKDWILFFDEADSLFGKRTQLRDSHDRYANQEVSFLLQRIEIFDGLIILASNLTNNVDEAFARRFEHMVHFPMPKPNERLALWKKSLPDGIELEPGLNLGDIATRYELSGGTMMNVVRHCCLQAISRGSSTLRQADFEEGVRREYAKENRLQ